MKDKEIKKRFILLMVTMTSAARSRSIGVYLKMGESIRFVDAQYTKIQVLKVHDSILQIAAIQIPVTTAGGVEGVTMEHSDAYVIEGSVVDYAKVAQA